MAAKTKTSTKKASPKTSSTVAKLADGTIQITFTIPSSVVTEAWDEALGHIGENIEVEGFRKGKAPKERVLAKVGENKVIEHALQHLLPQLTSQVITEEKLRIAIYPRYELLSTNPGEDWQVRATTCELPKVDLGEYKKAVKGAKGSGIWTPDKGGEDKPEEQVDRQEVEAKVIEALLKSVSVTIPQILIDEEANSRLARLLERLEKLGLSLEAYLASNGKTSEQLRSDYEQQSKDTITLDLALSEVATQEKLTVAQGDIEAAVKAQEAVDGGVQISDAEKANRESIIRATLMKRAALDFIIALA